MVGTTLLDIRSNIEALADESGSYYLVCARTGERPFPAVGERFRTRALARNAARATEQYRAALRDYDPQVPRYDIVVCQRAPGGEPATDTTGLTEFCHDVAAAVFESLSESGFGTVETAAMDRYFDLAETLTDPDDLCLRLLEGMAAELDARLDPAERAAVVRRAAAGLDRRPSASPVASAFEGLRSVGLLGEYDLSGPTVSFSEYALAARNGRLPVLPIAVSLRRRGGARAPSPRRVERTGEGWRLTLGAGSAGAVSVPVR
jgi:hypothetical protein